MFSASMRPGQRKVLQLPKRLQVTHSSRSSLPSQSLSWMPQPQSQEPSPTAGCRSFQPRAPLPRCRRSGTREPRCRKSHRCRRSPRSEPFRPRPRARFAASAPTLPKPPEPAATSPLCRPKSHRAPRASATAAAAVDSPRQRRPPSVGRRSHAPSSRTGRDDAREHHRNSHQCRTRICLNASPKG